MSVRVTTQDSQTTPSRHETDYTNSTFYLSISSFTQRISVRIKKLKVPLRSLRQGSSPAPSSHPDTVEETRNREGAFTCLFLHSGPSSTGASRNLAEIFTRSCPDLFRSRSRYFDKLLCSFFFLKKSHRASPGSIHTSTVSSSLSHTSKRRALSLTVHVLGRLIGQAFPHLGLRSRPRSPPCSVMPENQRRVAIFHPGGHPSSFPSS